MKPSLGRIVFCQLGNKSEDVAPAIITRVHSDDCVNLTVFPDNSVTFRASSSMFGFGPGCWRWPPRVKRDHSG